MTIAGAKYKNIMEQPDEEISYVYKRLLHTVPTGVYECNSRCKCNSRCLNRVVQNPIQVKLQVFRTNKRGWGLQALHDIPKGTFICIYAGLLYTEKQANAMCHLPGVEHGDEYFAELDYIETTQVLKDGYESDVMHMDDDHDDSDSDFKEDDYEEDKTDVDYVANTNSGPREIVTRSSARGGVSRNNSVDGEKRSEAGSSGGASKSASKNNSDSDSDGSCIEISDDEKDGKGEF
jgi:histone-lysine N-methyltransferase SETDB1